MRFLFRVLGWTVFLGLLAAYSVLWFAWHFLHRLIP